MVNGYSDLMRDFIDSMEISMSELNNGYARASRPVLGSLHMNEDNDEMWREFFRTCNILVRLGAYDRILYFVMGVFTEKGYDRTRMKKELQKIKAGDNTLYDLSVWFYQEYLKEEPGFEFRDVTTAEIEEKDPFEETYSLVGYDMPAMVINMDKFILTKVYGLDYTGELTNECVDEYLESVENVKASKHAEPLRINSCVLNTAYTIMRHAELDNNDAVAWHVLDKWIFPLLRDFAWTDKYNPNIYIQLVIVQPIYDYLLTLLGKEFKDFYKDETGDYSDILSILGNAGYHKYTDKDFIRECVGNRDVYYLKWARSFNEQHPDMAGNLYQIIERGYQSISFVVKHNETDLYIMLAILLEYVSGETDKASNLLLKYHNRLTTENKNKLVVQIVLIRCIFECEDHDLAGKLYSIYSAETSAYDEETNYNEYLMREMVQFINDSKKHILESKERELSSWVEWRDIIFCDGRNDLIDRTYEAAVKKIENGEIIDSDLARDIYHVVDALSHYEGVDYRRLGCKEYHDEYAYDLLTSSMGAHGRALANEYYDETRFYYKSVKRKESHELISYSLKMRLFQLEEKMLEEQIGTINNVLERWRKDDTSDELKKELEKQIDDYLEMLSERLLKHTAGHDIKKGEILASYSDFIKQHSKEDEISDSGFNYLSERESIDITNYLVTSEIVFDFLKSREYSEDVDFSAALISLTKSLEVAMNHIFNSMDVRYDQKYDDRYFNKNRNHTRRESIELGPAIKLLQSQEYINYGRNGQLYCSGEVDGHRLFEDWNGSDVIDIRKLRDYSDISVKFNQWVRRDVYEEHEMSFGNNDEQNRMLLVKGLDYIRLNYRNKVAHKEEINRSKVTECRKLLIQSEKLLWVLISILKK